MPAIFPSSAPRWLTDPAVRALDRLGVTPNMITALGVAGNIAAGVLAGFGEFLAAGVVMLAASALDFLDGALARATGRASDFGSVFDATMDRVSEAAVLFGLIVWYAGRGGSTEEILIFLAVVGSILVSYVRARAEMVGLHLPEGLFTRGPRVVLLAGGLILEGAGVWDGTLTAVLAVLAAAAGFTVVERLWLVWSKLKERPQ
jgi:CDP-diacylglycerol--glycerol-3-phosphate 3-phosphatidyltransferase